MHTVAVSQEQHDKERSLVDNVARGYAHSRRELSSRSGIRHVVVTMRIVAEQVDGETTAMQYDQACSAANHHIHNSRCTWHCHA